MALAFIENEVVRQTLNKYITIPILSAKFLMLVIDDSAFSEFFSVRKFFFKPLFWLKPNITISSPKNADILEIPTKITDALSFRPLF